MSGEVSIQVDHTLAKQKNRKEDGCEENILQPGKKP
jgi:hypothetical protein